MSIEHRTRAVIIPDGEYKPTIKDKIIDLWDNVGYNILHCKSGAENLEEHLQLPYSKRHKLGFWYTEPSFDFKDYRKQDDYFRKTYPIQFYIRNKILFKLTPPISFSSSEEPLTDSKRSSAIVLSVLVLVLVHLSSQRQSALPVILS